MSFKMSMSDPLEMNMAAFHKLLGRPIAFHRCFVEVAGSVAGAVFLSQAVYWSQNSTAVARDGWFYKTMHDWSSETGMSRFEIESARKSLRARGILEESRQDVPAKLYYRLDFNKLASSLLSSELESRQEVVGIPAES